MNDLKEYLNEQLKNEEFKKEYEASRAAYEVKRALVAARIGQNMTQKDLSERSGIRQSNISRIESGKTSPTLDTLQALAEGMGKKLVVLFE